MFTLFDAFAGYGGAHFALKKANIPHEPVGFSENNDHAIYIYELNHPSVKNFGDITKINPKELPDFNLFCGGFPCQPFSQAGDGKGEIDTRGTLFHDIVRICDEKRPDNILLENVKGLITKRHESTLTTIRKNLENLDYYVHIQLINSKDYGIPQNRERVWIYATKKEIPFLPTFDLAPQKVKLERLLPDYLDKDPDSELYRSKAQIDRLIEIHGVDFNVKEPCCADLYNKKIRTDGVCITITEPHHNNMRVVEPPVNGEFRVRKFSETEHFRLMGFKNGEINLGDSSYAQACTRAGNGWDINIASIILKNIFNFYYNS
jgi:DNA (cytosine-5)-methyltransferase 1